MRVDAKPKEKKEEKKREMKLVGKVRKKKDKKEVTCYYCWEKEHYVFECLKKMITQNFIVEVLLGGENIEEKYLELTKNTLVTNG
jgi:nucleoside diphosphate kinase